MEIFVIKFIYNGIDDNQCSFYKSEKSFNQYWKKYEAAISLCNKMSDHPHSHGKTRGMIGFKNGIETKRFGVCSANASKELGIAS